MDDSLKELFNGWILHSMKSTIEDQNVRNEILEKQLTKFSNLNNVVFGETFEGKVTKINKYLSDKIGENNKIILFTISNRPDPKTGETHYQSFILDNKNKNLVAFDPARTTKGEGIYSAYAAETVENYIKTKKSDYEFIWYVPSHTCQSSSSSKLKNKTYDEVFCQTWSLYLQIKYMENLLSGKKDLVDIPSSNKGKVLLLLNFFKTVVTYPITRKTLNDEYNVSINHQISMEENPLNQIKKDLEKLEENIAKFSNKLEEIENPKTKKYQELETKIKSGKDEVQETTETIEELSHTINNLKYILKLNPVLGIEKMTVEDFYFSS